MLAVICFGGILYGWQPEASTKKADKRKRKYGADQEPVSAELKTEMQKIHIELTWA